MVKVVFDLRWVRGEQIDGIGRYTLGLTNELRNNYPDAVYLYHQERLLPLLKTELRSDLNFLRVPWDILSLEDFFKTPGFLRSLKADVFLSPHYITSPWHKPYRLILIVHDLIPFLYKKYLTNPSFKLRLFYMTDFLARIMLKKADYLIANSEATRRDVVRKFKVHQEKVVVCYPGFDTKILGKAGKGGSIFYLGRMEPYKNLEFLVRGYASLPVDLRAKHPLVLGGGKKEPYYSRLTELVKKLGIETRVQFVGYVAESDLPRYYSNASIFVYPSLYEGFGLPVLEARAAGIPVITTTSSSLPEAGGSGAILVSPTDVSELTQAMKRLLTDENLRQKLKSGNADLHQQFSWAVSAKKVIKIIEKISN